jgi:hypothetical protein
VVIAAATLAVPAWSASTPPKLTAFTVGTVHTSNGGLKVAVGGSINCTASAHFHIWVWVYQSSRGALAHLLFPATLAHPTKKQRAQAKRKSACTGAAQRWTVKGRAEGKHPASFAPGPAQVCTVVTVSHSRRYVLQSNCSSITIP